MTAETQILLGLDVDELLVALAAASAAVAPEDRVRHASARERARFEAARFLLRRGSAEDRLLAARWALRRRREP